MSYHLRNSGKCKNSEQGEKEKTDRDKKRFLQSTKSDGLIRHRHSKQKGR